MALQDHLSLVRKVQVLFAYLDSLKTKFEGLAGRLLNWVSVISHVNPGLASMVIYGFCMGVGFFMFIVTALLHLAAGTHILVALLHVMEGLNGHVLSALQLLNGLLALLMGFSILLGHINININVDSNRSRPNSNKMSALLVRYKMIGALPNVKYGSLRRRSDDGNTNDSSLSSASCVICLGCIEEEDGVRILPNCRHYFHISCIDRWLLECAVTSSSCPLCRASVIAL